MEQNHSYHVQEVKENEEEAGVQQSPSRAWVFGGIFKIPITAKLTTFFFFLSLSLCELFLMHPTSNPDSLEIRHLDDINRCLSLQEAKDREPQKGPEGCDAVKVY